MNRWFRHPSALSLDSARLGDVWRRCDERE
jgi:hypothetical protein